MKDFETHDADQVDEQHALAMLLWGKASRDEQIAGPEWHPLLCHMLDVMHVADLLWERLPQTSIDILSRPFGDDENCRNWFRLLFALHDAGKATPGFQQKWPGHVALHSAVELPKTNGECHPHGISGTAILATWLSTSGTLPKSLPFRIARSLARAVASHHGEFARDKSVLDCTAEDVEDWIGKGDWQKAHQQLLNAIASTALVGPLPDWQGGDFVAPEFTIILAGLTAVADWIGSNAEVFSYSRSRVALRDYTVVSRERAREALGKIAWQGHSSRTPRQFADLFPFPPRSLQLTTQDVLAELNAPCILIVESTMGDGKTEAALLVTESLGPRIGHRGFFIGLPTQATSNQMLGRVEKFLKRVGEGAINLHLVHGDAGLSDDYQRLRLNPIYGDEKTNNGSRVQAESWFTQRKRSLLADYAVGTIDQSLLSVLQTRHNFVRLFGLAGKIVILDEVHAYDTYTSELLTRLVSWLSALGSTVVILSATLPKARRLALLEAYGAVPPSNEAPYPRVTAGTRGCSTISQGTLASRPSQRLQLRHLEDDVEQNATQLLDSIEQGGCAAWICNTVARAQIVYATLSAQLSMRGWERTTSISLLHSRFLKKDRSRLEKLAETQFGPDAQGGDARPERAVLVGTQVIEQSLDLDFDLMISDLAPIDLLLQRSGRLHRHDRSRPAAHLEPRLWVINPEVDDERIPSFKKVAPVYQEDVMLRTYAYLRSSESILVPDELESWIEQVYGDKVDLEDHHLQKRLDTVAAELENERRKHANQAAQALLFCPSTAARTDRFGTAHSDLIEGDTDDVHTSLRAQTRLGEPTADAVCLWQTNDGYSFEPSGEAPATLVSPSSFMLRRLLEHSVKVDLWRLKQWSSFACQPSEWSTEASLRNRWLLKLGPDSEAAGINLNPELGLTFKKRKQANGRI